jgi:hypothetical protein
VGMKSLKQDGGECLRKWHATRHAHLLRLSGETTKTLCMDQLNATICCRYVESLLENPRISRYLARYHSEDLRELKNLLDEFTQTCQITSSKYDPR